MTTAPVTFIASGPYSWGSSRMRAYWPAQRLGAAVIEFKDLKTFEPGNAGVVIWQKQVDLEVVRETTHLRHVWDVCDPAWWWQPDQARLVADAVDAVVCSSGGLAADFENWYSERGKFAIPEELPVITIPDRLDLAHFPQRRSHELHSPIRLIWFGVAVNRIALYGALANLERLAANDWQIELTICDDRPDVPFNVTDSFPIYHVTWNVDQENRVIAGHDIALLPPYPGPWGLVKSNNKALTAWACGLPVTQGDNYDLLRNLVGDERTRQFDADMGYNLVTELYTVDQTVADWQELIGELTR